MIDLKPAPVPELSEQWIGSHRSALLEAIGEEHHQRPAKWVVLGSATVAAAASVSALLLAGGSGQVPTTHVGHKTQAAFLGWSASPTKPAIGQLTAADTSCRLSLVQLPPINKGTVGVSLVPELNDVRGPFTVTVFGNGTQNEALCVSTSKASSAIRWFATSGTSPSPGTITDDQVSYGARDGQPYTLVVGRIGTGVTGVTLSLENGDNVTTTSGNGLFVAWWPGSQRITSATIATASGASTQPSNLAGPGNGNSTVCLHHGCGR
jgi:hypothetical protein